MAANIRPGDIVYDVGAEEGDISALCAMWARCNHDFVDDCRGPGGVVLFEPNARVWPNIRAIFEANGLAPLASWVGFAGDHESTRLGTNALRPSPAGGSPWPGCADGPVIGDHGFCNLWERPDIPSVALDDFAALTGLVPDVVTIDVEGSELRVLRGMAGLLETARPLIYVSVHPAFMLDMYGDKASELHRYLAQTGYVPQWLATDHEDHYVFEHPDGRRLVGGL